MYFDEPAEPFARPHSAVETALIAVCALFVSPLGYFLIGPLGKLSANAASVF
jgi:NADH-quinone oxidoreductase subunit N